MKDYLSERIEMVEFGAHLAPTSEDYSGPTRQAPRSGGDSEGTTSHNNEYSPTGGGGAGAGHAGNTQPGTGMQAGNSQTGSPQGETFVPVPGGEKPAANVSGAVGSPIEQTVPPSSGAKTDGGKMVGRVGGQGEGHKSGVHSGKVIGGHAQRQARVARGGAQSQRAHVAHGSGGQPKTAHGAPMQPGQVKGPAQKQGGATGGAQAGGPSTVKITGPGGAQATGFFVDNNKTMETADHVAKAMGLNSKDWKPITLGDGTQVNARLAGTEGTSGRDKIATLQLDRAVKNASPLQRRDLTKEPLKTGEGVAEYGFPHGQGTRATGTYSEGGKGEQVFRMNKNMQEGASGAPIVDKHGRLVSVQHGTIQNDPHGNTLGLQPRTREAPAAGAGRGVLPVGRQATARAMAAELRAQGLSEHGIEGIFANVQHESRFIAGIHEQNPTGAAARMGGGYGLYQFTGMRPGQQRYNYMHWLQQNAPHGNAADPTLQTRYLAQYLRTRDPATWRALNNARSGGEAAAAFVRGYERPRADLRAQRERAYARGVPSVRAYTGER